MDEQMARTMLEEQLFIDRHPNRRWFPNKHLIESLKYPKNKIWWRELIIYSIARRYKQEGPPFSESGDVFDHSFHTLNPLECDFKSVEHTIPVITPLAGAYYLFFLFCVCTECNMIIEENAKTRVWFHRQFITAPGVRGHCEINRTVRRLFEAALYFWWSYVVCRFRLRGSDHIRDEVSRLVQSAPNLVSHYSAALQYLATPANLEADIPEVCLSLPFMLHCPQKTLSEKRLFSKNQIQIRIEDLL